MTTSPKLHVVIIGGGAVGTVSAVEAPVSFTHLTLPPSGIGLILVVAGPLKKKKCHKHMRAATQ